MQPKKLKYEFTQEVVQYLLKALNRVQITGLEAEDNVAVKQMLQKPINAEELEKNTLGALKEKYEKKKRNKCLTTLWINFIMK